MWIANYSLADVKKGNHIIPNDDTVLIQICDPKTSFPKSPYKFVKIYQFRFYDTNEESHIQSIQNIDAIEIATVLNYAYENKLNVLVHCHAGVCRSGAVVEAGKLLGFEIPDGLNTRIPNTLVFSKIRKALGFLNSWE